MGYAIECSDSTFRFLKPKAALGAMKAANRKRALFAFAKVAAEVEAAKTVHEALESCGWEVETDDDTKVSALFYDGKVLTTVDDVERLFRVLAPFVKSGSYLLIRGEDGTRWRYVFRKGVLRIATSDPDDSSPSTSTYGDLD